MRERWQWLVMGVVAFAHVAAVVWLSHAMVPPRLPAPAETVMFIELIDPAEPEVPSPIAPPAIDDASVQPASPPPPEADVRLSTRRAPVTMEAVIEPRVDAPPAVDDTRDRVAPERDPFSRPMPSQGFGRRDVPTLPEPHRPRIAGERPFDAPLPELHMRERSPKRIAEAIGRFIGGGSGAPVDAPCGGRLSGGFGTADSFSPNWQRDYGCGDMREREGFDGTVELPPGIAGETER